VALGALLFGLHAWVGSDAAADERPRIEIGAIEIDELYRVWTATWGRPPTESELRQMIDERVREEVLFREALAMDLDSDDLILRRRMVQKLEFLLGDLARLEEPGEAELADWFESNAERYGEPTRISFIHVYVRPEVEGQPATALEVERRAEDLLSRLLGDEPPDPIELGDRFLAGHVWTALSEEETARLFGADFAAELFALATDTWKGPLASSYGLHLVRVDERVEARAAVLEAVDDRVRLDMLSERRSRAEARAYASLRERYQVLVDDAACARALSAPPEDQP
jgi:hypothetical protein